MNIKGEVKMLKYDDPRVWKSNAEDVKIEIPSCVNPPLKKIKITQNEEMPIKDMSQYRRYVLSEKEQEKKEENKEEEVMAENKKSSCGKKRAAWIAASLAATAAVGGATYAIDMNRPFYNIKDATDHGCTYELLGINKTIADRIEAVERSLKSKNNISAVAHELADVGIDAVISKIDSALGDNGDNVAIRYGRRKFDGLDKPYIIINNEEVYDGEGGENRHKVANEIMVGLDAIIEIQGEIDYMNGPYYNPSEDNEKIYKNLEKLLNKINKTAALVIRINKDGDIIQVSREEQRKNQQIKSNSNNDEPEIGD